MLIGSPVLDHNDDAAPVPGVRETQSRTEGERAVRNDRGILGRESDAVRHRVVRESGSVPACEYRFRPRGHKEQKPSRERDEQGAHVFLLSVVNLRFFIKRYAR
jgi:hypothetical protein